MNSNEAHSHVFGSLLRKLGWVIHALFFPTGMGIILPHNFSCPPSLYLLQGELKEASSLWLACFSVLARALGICALKTVSPYRPIRTDVSRFTHRLQYINKFRGRSQFPISRNGSVCLCACASRSRGQRGTTGVLPCHSLPCSLKTCISVTWSQTGGQETPPCPSGTMLGLQTCSATHNFLCRCWWFELRISPSQQVSLDSGSLPLPWIVTICLNKGSNEVDNVRRWSRQPAVWDLDVTP